MAGAQKQTGLPAGAGGVPLSGSTVANASVRGGVEPGVLLVLAAAICWGTTGTTQAFAPAGVSPLSVGAARLLVGGLALLAVAAAQGLLRQVRDLPAGATFGAALAMAAYQLTFFAGVRMAGVAAGTIVAIGSGPMIAGALVWLVQGRVPGRRWALATAMAVMGCTLIALAGSGGAGGENVALGLLLALGAGASYAVYSFFSAGIVQRVPANLAAASTFGLGALFLLPLFAVTDSTWLFSGRGLGVALMLGLVATALAYLLYTRALRVVPVSTAVTLALAEPVVASLLGVALLGERLPLVGWAGVALVFAGLLTLTVVRR